jgi:RES domain-containing protein
MIAYRIIDARHPIFDPTGAMLHGGRWNSVGGRVIYAAETYAGALLEILAHSNLASTKEPSSGSN